MTLSPIRFAPLALIVAACGGSPGAAGDGTENTGQTSLAITTVPSTVQCIQITTTGSTTVTSQFSVSPGASSVGLSLIDLPLGSDTINGQAYDATCDSIAGTSPTYVADPQTVTLQAGVITNLTMTFRPENSVSGTANFVGNVVEVDPTLYATFLVMSDGTVEASGSSFIADTNTFAPVPGLTNVAHVVGGSDFDCALLTNGTVECWGANEYGQLGNGTTTSSYSSPVAVTGVTGAIQLVAGSGHACALTSYGYPLCWGHNASGQLGNRTTTNATTPVSGFYTLTDIAAAGNATCGIMSGGIVTCTGDNSYGELGLGNTTNEDSFGYETVGTSATISITGGMLHFCALRADGTVRCWGLNSSGQLGNGTTNESTVPVQVPIAGVTEIAASAIATCAQSASGLYCWGDNANGEIGDGTGTNRTSPVLISFKGAVPATSIQSGTTAQGYCARLQNVSIDCWGFGGGGEFGGATSADSFVPMPISVQ